MNELADETRLRAALAEQATREVPVAPGLWPKIAPQAQTQARARAPGGTRARWVGAGVLVLLVAAGWILRPPAEPRIRLAAPPERPVPAGSTAAPLETRPPAPPPISPGGELWSAQNVAGFFQIVVVDVRAPRDVLLFYAMRTGERGTPRVAVQLEAAAARPPATPIALAQPIMYPLGQLAEFDVGFMQIAWPQPVGTYTLVVDAAPPAGGPTWRVRPVRELRVVPNERGYGMMADAPRAVGQVGVTGAYGSQGFGLALLGRSPAAVPPLYIALEADGTVRRVDVGTWNALWPTPPARNGPAVPTEDLAHPYIAPTYPPTAFAGTVGLALPPGWNPDLPPPPPTQGPPALSPTGGPAAPAGEAWVGANRANPTGGSALTVPVTEAKIRAYVGRPAGLPGVGGQHVQVTGIRFLSAQALAQLTGDRAFENWSAAEPLVYVTLTGDFEIGGGPVHWGECVFAARTGNLLMSGAGPRAPTGPGTPTLVLPSAVPTVP